MIDKPSFYQNIGPKIVKICSLPLSPQKYLLQVVGETYGIDANIRISIFLLGVIRFGEFSILCYIKGPVHQLEM